MKVILKEVNIISPVQKIDERETDILLEDGVISKIGKLSESELKNARVFELKGKYIVPGFCDMHVHLREPGREDEETVLSGCSSAANGGFTAIACMPNTDPAIDSAEVVNLILEQANDNIVHVYPIGAATLGRKGEILSPMAELKDYNPDITAEKEGK